MTAAVRADLDDRFTSMKPERPEAKHNRSDISRADCAWCVTAIDWGWSIEDTATRLLEGSRKARENGQGYALTTAGNAAAPWSAGSSARRNSTFDSRPAPP